MVCGLRPKNKSGAELFWIARQGERKKGPSPWGGWDGGREEECVRQEKQGIKGGGEVGRLGG